MRVIIIIIFEFGYIWAIAWTWTFHSLGKWPDYSWATGTSFFRDRLLFSMFSFNLSYSVSVLNLFFVRMFKCSKVTFSIAILNFRFSFFHSVIDNEKISYTFIELKSKLFPYLRLFYLTKKCQIWTISLQNMRNARTSFVTSSCVCWKKELCGWRARKRLFK